MRSAERVKRRDVAAAAAAAADDEDDCVDGERTWKGMHAVW